MKHDCFKCGKPMQESVEFSGLWICVDFAVDIKSLPLDKCKCTGLYCEELTKKELIGTFWEYVLCHE